MRRSTDIATGATGSGSAAGTRGRRGVLLAVWVLSAGAGCFSESPSDDGGAAASDDTAASDDGDSDGSGDSTGTGTGTATGPLDTGSSDAGADASQGSSGGAMPSCGDGVPGDGEACDDANDDPLDGCSSDCRLTPRAVELMVANPPPPVGMSGAVGFTDSCFVIADGVPRVLRGLNGKLGGVSDQNSWTVSVAGGCSRLTLAAEGGVHLEIVDDATVLPERGSQTPELASYAIACAPGDVPVGLTAKVYSGDHIVDLRLACATPTLDADAPGGVRLDPAPPGPWTGAAGSGGGEQDAMCPMGAIMTGIRGDASEDAHAVWDLGPTCARASIVSGPP
ncbi:MAG: hypothetical protein IPH07_12910 [Deltaproteobacteria bacterium]|nr:hypothetical protein [Deltaproteobacteria bacterium]MBK8717030.1 hypothetical protein [Deltaproteobacteria bacterium]MBP7290623.1 hypothetical protein [Nannocystaceae bacterium]